MIYFIQENEPGRNRVKIGYTSKDDVSQRMRELQTASPTRLQVLGVMEGDQGRERLIHILFAGQRVTGEWFEPSTLLHDFITEFGDCVVSTPAAVSGSQVSDNNLMNTVEGMIAAGARLEKNSSGYYRLRWQVKDENGKPVINENGGYVRKSMYIPSEFVHSMPGWHVVNGEVKAVQP